MVVVGSQIAVILVRLLDHPKIGELFGANPNSRESEEREFGLL